MVYHIIPKTILPNDVFVAIHGHGVDGHNFIDQAIEAGAIAVVGEKKIQELPVPYIQVSNSRLALAKMACQFYGNPSRNKIMIGVTGTNGKTTTAFMLKSILESTGRSCSLFGTVQNIVNGQVLPSATTTLDALEIQRQLSISKDEVVILEVSSHGLSQFRVAGIEFDYCLFTNLDQDHLDYHHDMDDYFSAKSRLFDYLKPQGKAIINGYTTWGLKLINKLKSSGKDIYILGGEDQHHARLANSKEYGNPVIIEGSIRCPLKLNILGHHNVLNASMAFLTARQIGLAHDQITEALRNFVGVPGRFEVIKLPNSATIVIDYAHTVEALYHCLQTARDEGAQRIFHVFGFRGNRDPKKRIPMLNASKQMSDYSVLTMDDLNTVPFVEMKKLLHKLNPEGCVITDRTMAINNVLTHAKEGDWVLITGKGHELYQQEYQLPTRSDKETILYVVNKLKSL